MASSIVRTRLVVALNGGAESVPLRVTVGVVDHVSQVTGFSTMKISS